MKTSPSSPQSFHSIHISVKRSAVGRLLHLAALAALGVTHSALAADNWWDTTTTGLWSNTSNWWTTAGGTTNPGAAPTAGDSVIFNGTGVNGATTVQLDAPTSIDGLTFSNTGATTIMSSNTTAQALTIGTGGITVNSGAGNVTIGNATNPAPLVLNGNSVFQKAGNGTLTIVNSISGNGSLELKNNNAGTISLASTTAGAFNFTGSITNSGNGTGAVNLGGSSTANALIGSNVTSITQNSTTSTLTIFGSNAFTGGVIVRAGTANLVNSNVTGGASGSITLGDTSGTAAASIFMGSGAGNASPITVQAGSSGNKTIGSIYAAGGTGTTMTWSGNITANDSVTVLANGNPSTGLVLSGASISIAAGKTMTLNNAQATASKLNISGNLNGPATSHIVLTTGGATLSGNNSLFAGDITQQSASTLNITNANALGTNKLYLKSTQSGTGTTLGISGGITVATPIEMDSTTGRENITSTGTGDNSLTGGFTITGASGNALVISNNQGSGNLTISGGISGASYPGSVSLRGSLAGAKGFLNGAVTLASDLQNNGTTDWTINAVGSSYNSTRFANTGNFILGANNGLATNAQVYWGGTAPATWGRLDMAGFSASVAGLNSTTPTAGGAYGNVTNSGGSDSTLTLANMLANLTYAGVISDGPTKKISLEMNSTGRSQTLSGNNTYTGATVVTAGTLVLSGGSLASGSAVAVNGGIFGGNGTVGGDVTLGSTAILQAGSSLADTATLTLSGNLTAGAGSFISLGLGATATTHDVLACNPSATSAFQLNQSFVFLDQGALEGTTYLSIITGVSPSLDVSSWSVSNGWTGTFANTAGNIDFTLAAIPEPGTWVLVGLGLGFTLFRMGIRSRRLSA